jgi:hypothetical protein
MTLPTSGYSAHVEMYLQLADRKLSVGQLGPAHCILEDSGNLPPQNGEIVVIIDGHETRRPVYLPHGISPTENRVAYETVIDPSPITTDH